MVPNRLLLYGLPYAIALSEYGRITGMAMPIIMFPSVCIGSFSNLLIPEFSSLLANGNTKRMIQICQKTVSITSVFSILIASILFFFSNELSLAIFQNLECANYIKILSPLVLFMYLDNIVDNILKGLHDQFKVMVCNIIDLVITITLLYFLLPILGINGFIIAIYVSEIFNFSVSYFELHKITGFQIDVFQTILKPVIICSILLFVIKAIL